MTLRSFAACAFSLAAGAGSFVACSLEQGSEALGGGAGTGGVSSPPATGGVATTGGSPSLGGGVSTSGGGSSGGSANLGGSSAVGGGSGAQSGGAPIAGGQAGSLSGGSSSTGGVSSSTGGSPSSAGSLGTGGSPASGGAAGAAGALNVGGSGVSGNGTCTVEDCGKSCTIPTLPESSALSANAKLPDPFKMMSGTRIAAKSEWECRRAEISAQVQKYEMGVKTPKPVGAVTGSLSGSNLTVTVGGKTFSVGISAPSNGKAPYPAIIALDGGSLPTDAIKALGVAVINLSTTTMGDQTGTGSRGKGFFFDVNGADDGAGALIAWAWGTSRVIDALEATPAAKINPKRIAVTGCSRNGKGALAMGAFDERVALTIPQESGSGGTAAWRVSDAEDGGANKVQTLHEIVGENCWFKSSLSQFSNSASKLPYDHHSLLGMVAPRGLLIIENTDYQWLGVNSCITAATAAQMIYQGLGAPDNIGFTNSGHTHCGFNSAELPYLQAYIKKFLLDQSVDTKVWNVSKAAYGGGGAVDKAKWIDWTAPTLN